MVEFDVDKKVVEQVYDRKNVIIRPPLANIDKMFIVIATVPQPDFMLVDKLIVNCLCNNITPVLVVNKIDLCNTAFLSDVVDQYKDVLKILEVSSFDSNTLKPLKKEMKGCLSLFAGQSAVGKSSLINALLPKANREVGELSLKTERGKNCTRESQIFVFDGNSKIADTTGFSSLELKDIAKEQLTDYYAEIKKRSQKCAYNTCNHFGESEEICAVKQAVSKGEINKKRYDRYVLLFKELKELEKKRYG